MHASARQECPSAFLKGKIYRLNQLLRDGPKEAECDKMQEASLRVWSVT